MCGSGPRLEQQSDDLVVPAVSCGGERRGASLARRPHVDPRPVLQQQLDHCAVALLAGKVERREATAARLCHTRKVLGRY